jgi:hypothetical protein
VRQVITVGQVLDHASIVGKDPDIHTHTA